MNHSFQVVWGALEPLQLHCAYPATVGTSQSASVVRSKSLNLSAPGKVRLSAGRSHAAGQKRSVVTGRSAEIQR